MAEKKKPSVRRGEMAFIFAIVSWTIAWDIYQADTGRFNDRARVGVINCIYRALEVH